MISIQKQKEFVQYWNENTGLHFLIDRFPVSLHRFGHGETDDSDAATDTDESDVLAAIRREASVVHDRLAHGHGIFTVELLGATGAGKTALVEALVEQAPDETTIGVIAGDVAGDDDARRYRELGVCVVDITTGRECHLTPGRVDEALDTLSLERLDVLFIENVGNMVCPADFPLGAGVRAVVVSTTEGDDVIRKHPLVFQAADIVVINKIDVADAVGADRKRMREDVERIAPSCPVVETNAVTGGGIEQLAEVLRNTESQHHAGVDSSVL